MIHSNFLTSHLCLHLPSGLFPSSSSTKTANARVLAPTFAKCPDYLILLDLIIEQFENTLLCVTHLSRWGHVWDLITCSDILRWGYFSPSPNPEGGTPFLVSCTRLHVQYIQSYRSCLLRSGYSDSLVAELSGVRIPVGEGVAIFHAVQTASVST
jgi:hypothetical protein